MRRDGNDSAELGSRTGVGTSRSPGSEVFLAGRIKSSLEEVARQITTGGGRAHAAVIDALDDAGVNEYVDGIV